MEDEVISIIKRARKFVLFLDFNTWLKKEGNPLFDVAIEKALSEWQFRRNTAR